MACTTGLRATAVVSPTPAPFPPLGSAALGLLARNLWSGVGASQRCPTQLDGGVGGDVCSDEEPIEPRSSKLHVDCWLTFSNSYEVAATLSHEPPSTTPAGTPQDRQRQLWQRKRPGQLVTHEPERILDNLDRADLIRVEREVGGTQRQHLLDSSQLDDHLGLGEQERCH